MERASDGIFDGAAAVRRAGREADPLTPEPVEAPVKAVRSLLVRPLDPAARIDDQHGADVLATVAAGDRER
jgi:hypothetical protein